MKRFLNILLVCKLEIAYILAMVLLWLFCEYHEQHRPHTIVYSVAGRVVSVFVATNPDYISFEHRYCATNGSLLLENIPFTNHYWTVWNWLK